MAPSSTSPLCDLLDTPLMLNIATLTYAGQGGHRFPPDSTTEVQRDHLFAAYVERMVHHPRAALFSEIQTRQWLSWLAYQMQYHNQSIFYIEHMQPDWLPPKQRWRPPLVVGLVVALDYLLVYALIDALAFGLGAGISIGLSYALVFGVVVGLVASKQGIVNVEALHWSWSTVRIGWRSNMVLGVVVTVVTGIVFDPRAGLVSGPFVALIGMLFWGLLTGLSRREIETKVLPNQGIRRSAQNALVISLVSGLVIGLAVGLAVGIASGLTTGLVFGLGSVLVFELLLGLLIGLQYGGSACIQHLILRCLLVRNGATPWRYITFLDYATTLILLRKVGGGYIFIHRLLLDYFAKQYTGPETIDMNTATEGK